MTTGFIVDERFAESILHGSEHAVMGHRLLPFSAWHKFQLEHWNSPVLIGGASLWDVWLAVQICRSPYPLRARVKHHRSSWWHLAWWMLYGWRNCDKELRKFVEYVKEYNAPPKMWVGTSSTHEKMAEAWRHLASVTSDESERAEALQAARTSDGLAAGQQPDRDMDDCLEQVAVLCSRGHSPELAWNMGLGELVWLNVAMAKSEGAKINLWTPVDEMRMEVQRKKRAELIAVRAAEIVSTEGKSEVAALAHAQVRYWQETVNRITKLTQ